jgi:uncharacterized protein YdaU (DUF1376 family)
MDWHPRYHRDALEGYRPLSLEDRGAYTTLLDLMYERGGGLPDDERFLAGWMGVSVRLWRAIRARLIEAGKIDLEGGLLINARVRVELDSQAVRRRTNSESGANGGRKAAELAALHKKNSELDQAVAQARLKLKTGTETVGSEDKSSGAQRAVVDHDADAWTSAVRLLTTQGGMTEKASRAFFGKLLAANKLEPRDMVAALATASVRGTQDPRGLIAKSAQAIARRRSDTPPKRVGWV